MRILNGIDAGLRLLAAVRQSVDAQDPEPSTRQVDELLGEGGLNFGVQ
ncbi:MAG: hypothetical protein ACRDTS_01210 [Mycobacterium sp.]